jgi:cysteine desulfurase/selenocysteine lyase
MIDAERIRDDFPILRQTINGKRLVYLDSAASSQKPIPVLDAMRTFYENDYANVHRGVHRLATRATEAYESARCEVAGFVGARPESLVFTRNATEAINLVAHSWGRSRLTAGDEIILTVMEHHSNLVPWHLLASDHGVVLRHIPITEDFRLDLDAFERLITPRTKMVCVAHMSNTLGTVNPVKLIADRAHAAGAVVLVDGAQAVPHMKVDMVDLDCDFYAFSAHKMVGPSGIGALYAKSEHLEAMPPFLGGGEMIAQVRLDGSTYNVPPHKFEAGTPAIAEAVGFGAAAKYLDGLGMEAVQAYEADLARFAIEALRRFPEVRILGPETDRGGAVSFTVDGIHPHDLATVLDTEGVAVRAGHHCTMPLHDLLGIPASLRASFYIYNVREDAERLIEALDRTRGMFGAARSPA